MAAPTFVSEFIPTGTSGARSMAWPTHAAGDLGVVIAWRSGDQADAVPDGFTLAATLTDVADATGIRVSVYWKIATSSSEPTVTLVDTGDHQCGAFEVYRGVDQTTPINVVTTNSSASATTSLVAPSATTTVDDCLVLNVFGVPDDTGTTISNYANANLTGLAERSQTSRTIGNDSRVSITEGVKASAGATGTTTADCASSSTFATVTLAIAPPASGTTHQQACYASSSASAAIAFALTFTRVLTASATAGASLARMVSKTLTASATAGASLFRTMYVLAEATATATAALTETLVTAVKQQCYATASATASLAKTITKGLSTSASAVADVSAGLLLQVQGSAAATATAGLFKTIRKGAFGAASSATAAISRVIGKRLSSSSSSSASVSAGMLMQQSSSANAQATASSNQQFILKPDLPELVRLITRNVSRTVTRFIVRQP